MPYLMAHEDFFLLGIGALIVFLLGVRLFLTRHGARPADSGSNRDSSPRDP